MGLAARDLSELSGLGRLNVMMSWRKDDIIFVLDVFCSKLDCEFSAKISTTVLVLVWLKHCKTNFYCKQFVQIFDPV